MKNPPRTTCKWQLAVGNRLQGVLILLFLLISYKGFSQIEFIENKGQWDKQVVMKSNVGSGAFFLQSRGFTVLQQKEEDLQKRWLKVHGASIGNDDTIHCHAYAVEFVNSNTKAEIIPDKVLPGINNYFIGNDKSKWGSGCKVYKAVTYKDVYPGIDVRYYSDGAERLKYDIIAHPGSDISKIAIRYKGVDKLEIKNKELIIKTSLGENKELAPYSYQPTAEGRTEVSVRYELIENIVRFKVKDYDPEKTLVIDPTEIFFTYTGSRTDNWGFTATYGPAGEFFSGGIAFDNGFPVTLGAFQTTNHSGGTDWPYYDMGIMKVSADGRQKLYATFIGGSNADQPHSLFCDPQGRLVIAGRTNSPDYPGGNRVGPMGGWDIVVTKLSADGSNLIGSIKIGGSADDGMNIHPLYDAGGHSPGLRSLNRNYGDDARSEVILDESNNIYLASCTQSNDFPTKNAVQPASKGSQDGVVIKIDPTCSNILWSTYLGGSGDDAAYVLALGLNNNIYVGGGTGSTNMTGITGGMQTTNAGGDCDGFIVELARDGSTINRGTYIGTPQADQVYGIQTDKLGFVYVMGTTEGDWPVVNAPYFNSGAKQYISKLKQDLSGFVYSTTFGSANATYPNISPIAFLVDKCENVYVSGWGGKANSNELYRPSNVKGMPVTPDAIKLSTDNTGSDFYFFVLKANAVSQLYGSYFGQNDEAYGDHVDGGTSRFDKQGVIYQAMCANCGGGSFTGTPGTVSPFNGTGNRCNLGMLKIAMNYAGVTAAPRPAAEGIPYDTSGCIPLTVYFKDTLSKGEQYTWDWGDGSPRVITTLTDTSHTFTTVGVFRVMEIVFHSGTCNVYDTAYLNIKTGKDKAIIQFDYAKDPPCTQLNYVFTNTTYSTTGISFGALSFLWDFGDGTTQITTGLTPPVHHTYASAGTSRVILKLLDTNFCNVNHSDTMLVRVASVLKANFTHDDVCFPNSVQFQNTSVGGQTFNWDFGDGTTYTGDTPPPHSFPAPGRYIVHLHAYDPITCNSDDDVYDTVKIIQGPTADFTFGPNPPVVNTPTDFTNLSIGAVSYSWDFGDGTNSTEVNPSHQYIATNTFSVCLTAKNEFGCSAVICKEVSSLINPLLDVPSAFTPGKFGVNSIIKVRGFGIKDMAWKIYNRWGQKVFESNSISDGWDGYFKGKLQAMDVYTYTLDVTFSNGKRVKKTGDITLLR